MVTYRCRIKAPREGDWAEVSASSPAEAAQAHHEASRGGGIDYVPDPELPGRRVSFALVKVEGHGDLVSRIYTSGIARRGGVRSRPTIGEIAKVLGWEHLAADLLAPGWEGESEDWT